MTGDSYVHDRTPDDWTVAAFEPEESGDVPGDWETIPYVAWTYDPRPDVMVAVRPKTDASRWKTGSNSYLVEVDAGLRNETYTAPSTGRLPNIDLARHLMRGLGHEGVSGADVSIQLDVPSRAASAIGVRIRDWSDLEDLHNRVTGFEHIEGVGEVTSDRLERAIEGAFLERERVEVARNPVESDGSEKDAVYAAIPCLDGWRVRKEWRGPEANGDGRLEASVMLPAEQSKGGLYDDLDAATAAAEAFAEQRAANRSDVDVREVQDPIETVDEAPRQTSVEDWSR